MIKDLQELLFDFKTVIEKYNNFVAVSKDNSIPESMTKSIIDFLEQDIKCEENNYCLFYNFIEAAKFDLYFIETSFRVFEKSTLFYKRFKRIKTRILIRIKYRLNKVRWNVSIMENGMLTFKLYSLDLKPYVEFIEKIKAKKPDSMERIETEMLNKSERENIYIFVKAFGVREFKTVKKIWAFRYRKDPVNFFAQEIVQKGGDNGK